jgi:tRNA G10  N-methylase Trm11
VATTLLRFTMIVRRKAQQLFIDPFCGTGAWVDIAARMGRRAIGCDIKLGGTTKIAACDERPDAYV